MSKAEYFQKLSFLDRVIEYFRLRVVIKQIQDGVAVADLGAGKGTFLRAVETKISKGVALDRYENTIKNGKLEFIPFDLDKDEVDVGTNLNSLDVVTSLAVIEHVQSPEKLIRTAFKILRPGGKMIVTSPTPRSRWLLEFLALRLGVASSQEILEHKRYMWGYEIYNLAKDAGFSSAEWREFEFGMNTILVAVK